MDFATNFADVLIWDYKTCFQLVSLLAMIALGLAK